MYVAIKEVFGLMFEAILNGEMENYLGYENNSKSEKTIADYSDKKLKTSLALNQFRATKLTEKATMNDSLQRKFPK